MENHGGAIGGTAEVDPVPTEGSSMARTGAKFKMAGRECGHGFGSMTPNWAGPWK